MTLTKRWKSIKLGCGMTIQVRLNPHGVLEVKVHDFDSTSRTLDSNTFVVLVGPASIKGLKDVLNAYEKA